MTKCMLDPEDLESEYFYELERLWEASQVRFTDSFLLEVFGEAINSMDDKVAELKHAQAQYIQKIRRLGERYVLEEDLSSFFARMCIDTFFVRDLRKIEKSLFLIQRLKIRRNPPRAMKKGMITPEQIERAHDVSLVNVVERQLGQIKKTGKNFLARCPFHDDRTPSFYVYTGTNRFQCFGCGDSGDVITFVEKTLGLDFRGAIYYLIQN